MVKALKFSRITFVCALVILIFTAFGVSGTVVFAKSGDGVIDISDTTWTSGKGWKYATNVDNPFKKFIITGDVTVIGNRNAVDPDALREKPNAADVAHITFHIENGAVLTFKGEVTPQSNPYDIVDISGGGTFILDGGTISGFLGVSGGNETNVVLKSGNTEGINFYEDGGKVRVDGNFNFTDFNFQGNFLGVASIVLDGDFNFTKSNFLYNLRNVAPITIDKNATVTLGFDGQDSNDLTLSAADDAANSEIINNGKVIIAAAWRYSNHGSFINNGIIDNSKGRFYNNGRFVNNGTVTDPDMFVDNAQSKSFKPAKVTLPKPEQTEDIKPLNMSSPKAFIADLKKTYNITLIDKDSYLSGAFGKQEMKEIDRQLRLFSPAFIKTAIEKQRCKTLELVFEKTGEQTYNATYQTLWAHNSANPRIIFFYDNLWLAGGALAHELGHFFEDTVRPYCPPWLMQRDFAKMNGDYSYLNSYTEPDYKTVWRESEHNRVFVNPYSMTFPHEDYTTIFEMLTGNPNDAKTRLSDPKNAAIRKKTEYIRNLMYYYISPECYRLFEPLGKAPETVSMIDTKKP